MGVDHLLRLCAAALRAVTIRGFMGFIASLLASLPSVVVRNSYGNPPIHLVFIGLICGTMAYVAGSLATGGAARALDAGKSKAG